MNKLKTTPYFFYVVIGIIFLLNMIQSLTTELLVDEAYYWVYSQDLAFGYFDHPPLVALYIWISNHFFIGELGVRFISNIGYICMLIVTWKTIDHPLKKQYTPLFFVLFFSTALLNVYGFITVPDTPLLLFIALFLYAYKSYLKKKSFLSYLLLSLAMAGMLYSKYQGILVIFFVLISNLKLLRDPKILLSGLGTVLLFSPHLYWQFINDFPSIRYHLYERASVASYRIDDTLLHFVNAIAIIGFTFIIFYRAFFKGIKERASFHKGLNFIIGGFFVFFLFSSFRGHVQAQWLAPILLPLILITFNYLLENKKKRKSFYYLAIANICLILFCRIIVANENLSPVRLQFHGNKQWAETIKYKTKETDKLFINSYQNASIYWFYANEKAHYQKNYLGRKNQYGLIKDNESFKYDSIAHITRVRDEFSKVGIKSSGKDSIFVSFIKNYKPISAIEVNINDSENLVFNTTRENNLAVIISNPYHYDIHELDIEIVFQNKKANEIYSILCNKSFDVLTSNETIKTLISFDGSKIKSIEEFPIMGIGIRTSKKMELVKVSPQNKYKILP
ncbi:MAG: glycosyltransferase family 39 protein [Flavobacteriaceae bacterium]